VIRSGQMSYIPTTYISPEKSKQNLTQKASELIIHQQLSMNLEKDIQEKFPPFYHENISSPKIKHSSPDFDAKVKNAAPLKDRCSTGTCYRIIP